MPLSSACGFVVAYVAFALGWSGAALSQRLVTLDIAATNAQGEPVTDLQAADVQVREDGKVRPVVFLRFDGDQRAVAPAAKGEFVNTPSPSPMVLLFDHSSARMIATPSAWQEFENTLKQMPSLDRVYVDFATGRGELFRIHRLPLGEQLEDADDVSKDVVSEMDQRVRKFQAMRDPEFDDPVQRATATFEPLYRLVQQMSSIPGRKSLIWLTHNVPMSVRAADGNADFTDQIQEIIRTAARSNTAVYTIAQPAEGEKSDRDGESKQALQRIASSTGGRFYPKANVDTVMRDAAADAHGTYRLAYESATEATDPTEHKIRVESGRKGIHVRSPEVYRPAQSAQLDPDLLEQMALSTGSASPFDATDIQLRVTTSGSVSSGTMHFDVRVEPAGIFIAKNGDRYQAKLSIAFAFYGEGFLEQAPAGEPFNIDLSAEQFREAAKNGIHIGRDVGVTNKVQRVRVMVFDPALHGLGTVTIPIASQDILKQ